MFLSNLRPSAHSGSKNEKESTLFYNWNSLGHVCVNLFFLFFLYQWFYLIGIWRYLRFAVHYQRSIFTSIFVADWRLDSRKIHLILYIFLRGVSAQVWGFSIGLCGIFKKSHWQQSRRHALVGLGAPNKASRPPSWNMKHCKSVEFLSVFRMSSPPPRTTAKPHRRKAKPSIENFLATVLIGSPIFCLRISI